MIDIKLLLGLSNLKIVKEGTVLIRENQNNPEMMFIILNGTVEAIKELGTNDAYVVDTLISGRIFGEQCLFANDTPETTSYVCAKTLSVIEVSPNYFLTLAQSKPLLIKAILSEICKELAELKTSRRRSSVKIAPTAMSLALLPEWHESNATEHPKSFYNFLLRADKSCPFCKTTFNTDQIYSSKLKLKKSAGMDMRVYYTDFEPYWYNIMTCPHCYFSSFDDYFERDDLIYKSPDIVKALAEVKNSYEIDFEGERTLDFVFMSYYIALICAKAFDNEMQITSKIWLTLTYIYSDIDNPEIYVNAIKKANQVFNDFYGAVTMKAENEQYCCLLLAHFALELGEEEGALKFLSTARMIKGGKPVYKTMAENKYYDIREESGFTRR